MDPLFLIAIAFVILSIIFHEVAHGFVADLFGDPTARYSGRLTLNPLPHIDPIGSIIIPGILALTNSPFLIGWAKPVPYNPYNLNSKKWGIPQQAGEALVAFAGPATNILIAIIFGLAIRFYAAAISTDVLEILVVVVYANLALATLNMIPIPPLDGSKILKALLPYPLAASYARLETFTYTLGPIGLIGVLLLLIYVFSDSMFAFISLLFSLITGL